MNTKHYKKIFTEILHLCYVPFFGKKHIQVNINLMFSTWDYFAAIFNQRNSINQIWHPPPLEVESVYTILEFFTRQFWKFWECFSNSNQVLHIYSQYLRVANQHIAFQGNMIVGMNYGKYFSGYHSFKWLLMWNVVSIYTVHGCVYLQMSMFSIDMSMLSIDIKMRWTLVLYTYVCRMVLRFLITCSSNNFRSFYTCVSSSSSTLVRKYIGFSFMTAESSIAVHSK